MVFFCLKIDRNLHLLRTFNKCHQNVTFINTNFIGVEELAHHDVKYGRHRVRRSYARISEVLELPNLIEIQTDSYQWFLDEGIREMFKDISPIEDHTGNLSLEFLDYELHAPKYNIQEARNHDANYAAPIYVKMRLVNKETGEVKDQEVFFGDFPLMTEMGTFIINGAERVIVSQLVRSPGAYFHDRPDKNSPQLLLKHDSLKQLRPNI